MRPLRGIDSVIVPESDLTDEEMTKSLISELIDRSNPPDVVTKLVRIAEQNPGPTRRCGIPSLIAILSTEISVETIHDLFPIFDFLPSSPQGPGHALTILHDAHSIPPLMAHFASRGPKQRQLAMETLMTIARLQPAKF
jgi:hypothetical protein